MPGKKPTKDLKHDLCPERSFTIRLVDYKNRTEGGHSDIVWAPVIGIKEEFTFQELLEFPIYVLKNHGDTWNGVDYSYYLLLCIGAPLAIFTVRGFLKSCGVLVLWPYGSTHAREYLYELSIIGFTAAALEELVHLIYVYSETGAEVGKELWIGLFGVIVFGNGFPILIVCLIWTALRRGPVWKVCGLNFSSPYWAPLEIASGLSFFFLFGSGFFLGPAALALAGVLRLGEMCMQTKTITTAVPAPADQQMRVAKSLYF